MKFPLFKVHTPENIGQKIQEVFDSGFITEGEYSDKFEKEVSNYLESETLLVNSGTSSLSLAYHLCDIQPGDEVITSPMTCTATNCPIVNRGAKIVWADIDPETGNIDPNDVANKVNSKTKAIVAVHWAGQPFDVDAVSNFGVPVVEDAAHALGAKYKGKMAGTVGDFGCFSFQAIKHLTTIDGGALHCKDKSLNDRARKLRWFGLDRNFQGGSKWEQDIPECGYKFHMNNVNAVVGLEQMKSIDFIVNSHKFNGDFYDSNINNPRVRKLTRPKWSESSHWIYSLLVDDKEAFKSHLNKNNIACDVVHIRNDVYSAFNDCKKYDLTGVEKFNNSMLNIPVGWWLTNKELGHIVNVVNEYKG